MNSRPTDPSHCSRHQTARRTDCCLLWLWFACCVRSTCGLEACTLTSYAWNSTAQARFGLSINLRKSDRSGCGMVFDVALQAYVAAQWVTEKLNRDAGTGSYIPGVQFGFDLLDDCHSSTRSVHHALNYVDCGGVATSSQVLKLGLVGPMTSATTEETVNSLHTIPVPIISPSATLVSLTEEPTVNPNFFRTVPSDFVQMTAIVAILKRLGWTYIAVVHTDDNYGKMGSSTLKQLAARESICINASLQINSSATIFDSIISSLTIMRSQVKEQSLGVVFIGSSDKANNLIFNLRSRNLFGFYFIMSDGVNTNEEVFKAGETPGGTNIALGSLTLAPSNIVLQEFEVYLNDKFKKVFNGTESDPQIKAFLEVSAWKEPLPRVRQTSYVPLVVSAIFALAEAMRKVHGVVCRGVPGVCDQLPTAVVNGTILKAVKNISVNFTTMDSTFAPREFKDMGYVVEFDQKGDIIPKSGVPDYIVFAYNRDPDLPFIEVGRFSGNQLNLDMSKVRTYSASGVLLQKMQSSVCSESCEVCTSNGYIPLAYLPGSVYVIGIFSMHKRLAPNSIKCGSFRNITFDAVVVEAFLHSVVRLRNSTGINFGAIALDDCYSPLRITSILSEYFSGLLPCNETAFKVCVNPEKVVGVIGALSSGSSIAVTSFFTPLHIPVISYGSSSPDLDDKVNFPYFLRTVPSDEDQAVGLAEFTKSMGWSYVGALYVANNYGTKGVKAFVRAARDQGVCVADPVPISETPTILDEMDMYDAFLQLARQEVKVVIFFGINIRIVNFLDMMEKKTLWGRFIFVGSETWGTNNEIMNAGKKSSRGSITFKLDTVTNDLEQTNSLQERLLTKSPSRDDVNPWFSEFWQYIFQCNIPGGFNNIFTKDCDQNLKFSISQVGTMLDDERVKHVMNAVPALAQGLAQARAKICEGSFPCDNLRSDKYASVVYELIRNQTVSNRYSKENLFNDNGNGNIGFTIYNIQQDGDNGVYRQIGSYTRQNRLTLTKDLIRFYSETGAVQRELLAVCPEKLCASCVALYNNTTVTTATLQSSSQDDRGVVVLVIILALLIVCLVIFIMLLVSILYFKRKLSKLGRRSEPEYDEVNIEHVSSSGNWERGTLANQTCQDTSPNHSQSSSQNTSHRASRNTSIYFVNGRSNSADSTNETREGRTGFELSSLPANIVHYVRDRVCRPQTCSPPSIPPSETNNSMIYESPQLPQQRQRTRDGEYIEPEIGHSVTQRITSLEPLTDTRRALRTSTSESSWSLPLASNVTTISPLQSHSMGDIQELSHQLQDESHTRWKDGQGERYCTLRLRKTLNGRLDKVDEEPSLYMTGAAPQQPVSISGQLLSTSQRPFSAPQQLSLIRPPSVHLDTPLVQPSSFPSHPQPPSPNTSNGSTTLMHLTPELKEYILQKMLEQYVSTQAQLPQQLLTAKSTSTADSSIPYQYDSQQQQQVTSKSISTAHTSIPYEYDTQQQQPLTAKLTSTADTSIPYEYDTQQQQPLTAKSTSTADTSIPYEYDSQQQQPLTAKSTSTADTSIPYEYDSQQQQQLLNSHQHHTLPTTLVRTLQSFPSNTSTSQSDSYMWPASGNMLPACEQLQATGSPNTQHNVSVLKMLPSSPTESRPSIPHPANVVKSSPSEICDISCPQVVNPELSVQGCELPVVITSNELQEADVQVTSQPQACSINSRNGGSIELQQSSVLLSQSTCQQPLSLSKDRTSFV